MENLIEALPFKFRDIAELSAICTAEQPEKENIRQCITSDTDDFYIQSATIDGIKRWENVMEITPYPDATIDDRRFELMARSNNRAPFSERRILGMLDTLIGHDNYTFTPDWANFTLNVYLDLGSRSMINTLETLLNNMIPAHIDLTISLRYNTHQIVGEHEHEELEERTHTGIREEPF